MRRGIVPLVVSLLCLAGCATHTSQKEVSPNLWWVCDGDKDSSTCGPNPEKGLNKTCFTKGQVIEHYWHIAGDVLIVQCK
jgi:hypothetical protein